jgi:hypothetical protein
MLLIGQDVVLVKVTHNVAVDDVSKYEQFQSVYTKENTSTMPDKGQSKYPSMKDIVINTKGVFKLLKDLNPHKAL